MSALGETVPGMQRIMAPKVRLGRVLWRILPWFAFALLLVVVPLVLGASASGLGHVAAAAAAIAVYGLILALITELLSPDRPELRVIPLSDSRAVRLSATLRFLFFFLLFTGIGSALIEANGWRPGVADLLRILRDVTLVIAGVGLISATGVFKRMASGSQNSFWGALGRRVVRFVVPILVLALLFVVVARGLGYIPLANYVAENAAWTALKILAATLAYRWLRRMLQNTVRFYRAADRADGSAEDGAEAALAESDTTSLGIEKIGTGFLNVVVGVGTVFWILAQWDMPPSAILGALGQPLFAGSEVTWGSIVSGFAEVGGVLVGGWFLRDILTYFVFPRTKMGIGARYAVLAIMRYVIIALAGVLALGAIGMDTSSLGWFFGAAGIGIGLGLQDIIGNFVSGLIMLIERPVRVGDVVKVGDAVGKVENIHMRGTVIRTFDNTTILIPNKQLLGERVTNMTHNMGHARMLINIGTSYDTDPRRVREILLELAHAHAEVLEDPGPVVRLDSFTDTTLNFTLLCYTAEIGNRFNTASELRTALHARFREEGIKLPSPQRDLHIKSGWPTAPTT